MNYITKINIIKLGMINSPPIVTGTETINELENISKRFLSIHKEKDEFDDNDIIYGIYELNFVAPKTHIYESKLETRIELTIFNQKDENVEKEFEKVYNMKFFEFREKYFSLLVTEEITQIVFPFMFVPIKKEGKEKKRKKGEEYKVKCSFQVWDETMKLCYKVSKVKKFNVINVENSKIIANENLNKLLKEEKENENKGKKKKKKK